MLPISILEFCETLKTDWNIASTLAQPEPQDLVYRASQLRASHEIGFFESQSKGFQRHWPVVIQKLLAHRE